MDGAVASEDQNCVAFGDVVCGAWRQIDIFCMKRIGGAGRRGWAEKHESFHFCQRRLSEDLKFQIQNLKFKIFFLPSARPKSPALASRIPESFPAPHLARNDRIRSAT